ncbi:hypothetical protein JCM11641_003282 [Rhodosporidiobolus odoratus]
MRKRSPLLLAPLGFLQAAAQAPAGGGGTGSTSTSQACGWSSSCAKSSPCCTEYGYCSAGVGCLGGCNPQGSFGEGYCAPMPVCQSASYTFMDDSRFQLNHTAYDGDASKYDFTLDKLDSGNASIVQNGEMVLSLTEDGGGTRVSTTRHVLYGTIEASLKSVGAAGVVTAFITMSGVKDEIDWEFTTNDTSEAQTKYAHSALPALLFAFDNHLLVALSRSRLLASVRLRSYYWEGDVDNYSHGGTASVKNRDTTYSTYGLTWTPTQLMWTINGKTVRTLKKSDTKDGRYPQTPSRVQFSVWPAGVDGASQGTIDWSGGLIDWSSPDYTSQGYYAAYVQWLSIQCYTGDDFDLPYNGTSSNSTSKRLVKRFGEGEEGEEVEGLWKRAGETVGSYVWGANDTNGQISVTGSNAATIINSPYSTGQNMIVKKGDTKGVTSTKDSGGGTGVLGDNAVGNWWAKQKTAVHIGIIIGACALALFLFVAICTIFARSKDRRKRSQESNKLTKSTGGGGVGDAIPLVPKSGGGHRGLPGKFERQPSYGYPDSIGGGSSIKSGYTGSIGGGGRGTPQPAVPQIPRQYQQQQQGGYGYAPAPMSPYGGQPGMGGYGGGSGGGGYGAHATPQGYAHQWTGYGYGNGGRR